MKIRLIKGSQSRIITPIVTPDMSSPSDVSSGNFLYVPNKGYVELTDDITCSNGMPTLQFSKGGKDYYLLERAPLPMITGVYIFPTSELTGMLSSYTPPTLAEIFNEWTRISGINEYYPSGTTPQGEAAAWRWNGSAAVCTVNSSLITGFISIDTFEEYSSDVTITSSDGDDDYIMFVMAYARIGSVNHILAIHACRNSTGNQYGIRYVNDGNIWNAGTLIATHHVSPGMGGWNGIRVRIKVERTGTVFKVYASPPTSGTPVLDPIPVTFDAANYTSLNWLRGPLSYGYACHSQNSSSFYNIDHQSTSNDKNTMYDATTGDVWRWVNNQWTKDTSVKAWDVLGYPRKVVSVDGITYQIRNGTIVKL